MGAARRDRRPKGWIRNNAHEGAGDARASPRGDPAEKRRESLMFAVIKTGGKQYKVAKNDVVTVERLEGTDGDTIELNTVLMLGGGEASTSVGSPFVEGAAVSAEVLEQTRGPKVNWFKKRRRKNSRRFGGHKQDQTVLRITDITKGGESLVADQAATKAPPTRADLKARTNEAVTLTHKAKATTVRKRNTVGA
jgi:large subunit ribosomal protein L21